MTTKLWNVFLFSILCLGRALNIQDVESETNLNGRLFVLLVAGSNGWWNYRHQADVANAFQLLKAKGVSEENMIVMMYDDIANDPDNPYPGKLFNRPGGPDVYHGLKIDYRRDAVTPSNFLNVLQGKADKVIGGNRRVINSTAGDRIFVYFTDHGADGLIAFPNDILTKKDLNDALENMHRNQRYDQLVFYLEACESGSMFEGTLQQQMKIYAMTAAKPDESSWGTYCYVDPQLPCLGDLFSVNWMQDSALHDTKIETLLTQYRDVKRLTNLSTVMEYGNRNMTSEVIGLFEGERNQATTVKPTTKHTTKTDSNEHLKTSWLARDIELMHLQQLQQTANNAIVSKTLQQRINTIYEDRRNIESVFNSVIASALSNAKDRKQMMEERNTIENMKCHNDVVKAFDSICIDLNKFDYALKYIYVLNNLCVKIGNSDVIIDAMHKACSTTGKKYI